MSECYLSFGSNMDDRLGNITKALGALAGIVRIKAISDVYETEPRDFEYQGWFLNLVVRADFDGDPLELMLLIEQVEKELGKKKRIKNGPRIIDIDILSFDNLEFNTEKLILPHPKMTQRLFVLQPLKDVNSEYTHPVGGLRIDDMIKNCQDESTVMHRGNLMNKPPIADNGNQID